MLIRKPKQIGVIRRTRASHIDAVRLKEISPIPLTHSNRIVSFCGQELCWPATSAGGCRKMSQKCPEMSQKINFLHASS